MRLLLCWLSCVVLCFISGCSSLPRKTYTIGIDTSWYPLQLGSRSENITAFSTELLGTIGSRENVLFQKRNVNWDDLLPGLQQGEYEGILSSMPPYLFNQKFYNFSDLYLPLGPVLIVPTHSTIEGLHDLSGKEIAVISGSSNDLLLEGSAGVLIRYYDSEADLLLALVQQKIDGGLLGILPATAYLRDLYQHELKIITPPLTDAGLRLVTKHGAHPDLVRFFNKGLHDLKEDGDYQALLDKWSLLIAHPAS